ADRPTRHPYLAAGGGLAAACSWSTRVRSASIAPFRLLISVAAAASFCCASESFCCASADCLVICFCRNSTLLCRQMVRRLRSRSTVQISMPGTSCASADPHITDTTPTLPHHTITFHSFRPHLP